METRYHTCACISFLDTGDQFEGQPINPRLVKNPVYAPGEFQRIRDAFLAALSSNQA
jgi:hypothetical protein